MLGNHIAIDDEILARRAVGRMEAGIDHVEHQRTACSAGTKLRHPESETFIVRQLVENVDVDKCEKCIIRHGVRINRLDHAKSENDVDHLREGFARRELTAPVIKAAFSGARLKLAMYSLIRSSCVLFSAMLS